MSLPVCPRCGSGLITWLDPVPSGCDGCNACGYVGPVREFHAEPDPTVLRAKGITAALPDPIVMPTPAKRHRTKPEPSVVKEPPTVTRNFWYLRD